MSPIPSTPQGHLQEGQKEAAVAIIRDPEGRTFWQLRDEDIDEYPGLWGLFGGGIEPGEAPNRAIARELKEELELEATVLWDLGDFTHPQWYLHVFLLETEVDLSQLKLHEGQDWGLFTEDAVISERLRSDKLGQERGVCPPLAELFEKVRENQFLRFPPEPIPLSRT